MGAVYLSVDSRIKALLLEVMELSEYCTGLGEPRALPVIQSKMQRLNQIEQEVKNLHTNIHLKTDPISVDNPNRKNQIVLESEKIFSELLNDIQNARVEAQNAEIEYAPPPPRAVSPIETALSYIPSAIIDAAATAWSYVPSFRRKQEAHKEQAIPETKTKSSKPEVIPPKKK